MLRTLVIVSVLALAACDTPNSPTQTTADGTVVVQFQDGLNCLNNRCVRYNARNGWISVAGKNPTRIPSGIDVSNGAVTEAEFNRMFEQANRALASGAGRRG